VKRFSWNREKNEQLKKERRVSFEDVVFHIQHGDLLDILEHPNPKRFGRQRIFVVRINEYVYLVPRGIRGRDVLENNYSKSQGDQKIFQAAQNKWSD